jgi:hypothetical protein
MRKVKDQGIKRTQGPTDQRTKGPGDQGTRGPRERFETPGGSKTTRFENVIRGLKHCSEAGKVNIFYDPFQFFLAV